MDECDIFFYSDTRAERVRAECWVGGGRTGDIQSARERTTSIGAQRKRRLYYFFPRGIVRAASYC
jgi:hypothetical protein